MEIDNAGRVWLPFGSSNGTATARPALSDFYKGFRKCFTAFKRKLSSSPVKYSVVYSVGIRKVGNVVKNNVTITVSYPITYLSGIVGDIMLDWFGYNSGVYRYVARAGPPKMARKGAPGAGSKVVKIHTFTYNRGLKESKTFIRDAAKFHKIHIKYIARKTAILQRGVTSAVLTRVYKIFQIPRR